MHSSFLICNGFIRHPINALLKTLLLHFHYLLLVEKFYLFLLLSLLLNALNLLDLMRVQEYLLFIFVIVGNESASLHTTLKPSEYLPEVTLLHVLVFAPNHAPQELFQAFVKPLHVQYVYACLGLLFSLLPSHPVPSDLFSLDEELAKLGLELHIDGVIIKFGAIKGLLIYVEVDTVCDWSEQLITH